MQKAVASPGIPLFWKASRVGMGTAALFCRPSVGRVTDPALSEDEERRDSQSAQVPVIFSWLPGFLAS